MSWNTVLVIFFLFEYYTGFPPVLYEALEIR